MVIWLASFPRSGNTFFRMLVYYTFGLKTYSLYNDPLFDRLEASDVVGQAVLTKPLSEIDQSEEICFVKTHDLPVDDRPAIYLARDGRDALVSYAHFLLSYAEFAWRDRLKARLKMDAFQPLLRNLIRVDPRFKRWTCGGWSGNVRAWLGRGTPARTVLVRYEDLVLQPDVCLRRAVDRLQLSLPDNASTSPPSFEELHRRWPQFFRKGKVGAWRDEMSPALEALFWEYHAEGMASVGFAREASNVAQPH